MVKQGVGILSQNLALYSALSWCDRHFLFRSFLVKLGCQIFQNIRLLSELKDGEASKALACEKYFQSSDLELPIMIASYIIWASRTI